MKIAFIINPKSGTNTKGHLPDLIREDLDAARFSQPEIVVTEKSGHATDLARDFASAGFEAVVAVGGDGTVNETGRGLVHTETALGILPVGSGNGLARHLRIPMDIRRAIQVLNRPRELRIDYGKANEHIFFCTCGPGYDAHISQVFAESTRRGLLTYLTKNLTEFFSYQPENYRLFNDEMDFRHEAFILTFANASQFGNNAYIAPGASVKDGEMDIALLSRVPLLALPGTVVRLFNRTIDQSAYMKVIRAQSITLHRESEGAFQYDGEPTHEDKEIRVQIIHQGLKVWTPPRG